MPVKTDENGRRWVEMTAMMPGTSDQVWRAMATGPGNAAWFARAEIEEQVGGALRFSFGPGMESKGQVTLWEPPRCFGYVERDWMAGAPPVTTEITIAPRGESQCLLRMTHVLFAATPEWDMHLESFQNGWQSFFEILRLYLTHFADLPAATFMSMAPVEGAPLTQWKKLTTTLHLAGVHAGEYCVTAGMPQKLEGTVEKILEDDKLRMILLRLGAPAPGFAIFGQFAMGEGHSTSLHLFFYGADAAARIAEHETAWRNWLAETGKA